MIKCFKLFTTVIAVCILSYSFYSFANTAVIASYYTGNWIGSISVDVRGISKKPYLQTCIGDVKIQINKDSGATFIFSALKPFIHDPTKSSLTNKDCSDLVGNDLFNGRKFTKKMVQSGNPYHNPFHNDCITTSTARNGYANNLPVKLTLCRVHKNHDIVPDFLHGENKINNLPTYILLHHQQN